MSPEADSPYEQLTPVFAELGRAVYACQCFEWSLRHLLSLIAHETADGEPGAYEATWDFHNNKALNMFLKALKKRIDVPVELEEYLRTGIDLRNQLVHRHITDRAKLLYDPKGRLELEAELSSIRQEIIARDDIIRGFIDAFHQKYGTSRSEYEARADALWAYLNPPGAKGSGGESH